MSNKSIPLNGELATHYSSRNCVLSCRIQRSTLPRYQSEEMKILFIFSSGNQTHNLLRLPSNACAPDHDWPHYELILRFLIWKNHTVWEITQFPTSLSEYRMALCSTGIPKKKVTIHLHYWSVINKFIMFKTFKNVITSTLHGPPLLKPNKTLIKTFYIHSFTTTYSYILGTLTFSLTNTRTGLDNVSY